MLTETHSDMKKDFIRDYATEAYIYWARHGCPSYQEAVERIRSAALRKAYAADPQKASAYADAEVDKASAGLCDILACAEAFRILRESGKGLVCDAVKAVYMHDPWKKPKQHEISGRVVKFAMNAHVSERQVWYYLDEARKTFALMRGLRVSEELD